MTFYYLAERVLDRDDGEDSLSLCVIQIYIVYLVEGVLDGDDGEVLAELRVELSQLSAWYATKKRKKTEFVRVEKGMFVTMAAIYYYYYYYI